MIASSWKITHDPDGTPAVILDFGDILVDEIAWSIQREYSVTPLVRGASPFLFDGENIAITATFDRHRTEATNILGRKAIMDFLTAFPALGKKPIRIEAQGTDGHWQAASGVVHAGSPKISDLGTGRRVQSVSLVMTAITFTAPPP